MLTATSHSEVERRLGRLLRHNRRLLDLVVLETVVKIRTAIRDGDPNYAVQLWNSLEIEEQNDLWIRESRGSIIPKVEQAILK